MRAIPILVVSMCAALLRAGTPCAAAAGDGAGTLYTLASPPSALIVGCQPPCDCPAFARTTYGSFTLTRTGADPLYTYYTVERFIASFNNGPGAVAITGSGQYRIGGEVALLQQLVLDLDIEGQPTQHFDSGLVPLGAVAPRIAVECAVHGFWCYDSVLVVDAKPSGSAGIGATSEPSGLRAVRPNPFRGRTDIAFDLHLAGTVELRVLDLAGRHVRTLLAAQPGEPGPHNVAWDGRRDDGREAPAGVYWVVLRSPAGTERRRLVKLD